MNYLQHYFGFPLNELNAQHVAHYFTTERIPNNQQLFLPYNNALSLEENTEELTRSIAGLVNTQGGFIIWGSPKSKSIIGSEQKSYQDSLEVVLHNFEEADLINRIGNALTPHYYSLLIQKYIYEEGHIYLIEVPQQSSQAPHQYKNQYFTVTNGYSHPAPHHYIESLFKQNTFPQLEGYLKFKNLRENGMHYCIDLEVYIFNFSRTYNETEVSFSLNCEKGSFLKLKFGSDPRIYRMGGQHVIRSGVLDILYYGVPFSKELMLMVSPKDIINENFELDIILQFGGKRSPLKVSTYRISLAKLTISDGNQIIVTAKENQWAYQESSTFGKNKEQILQEILGR